MAENSNGLYACACCGICFYDQRNSTASKDKEVILHINEISKPIHIENDAEDCKKTEGKMI